MQSKQPPFFGRGSGVNELTHILALIDSSEEEFPDEFIHWLPDNLHVWNAFVFQAFKVVNRGFKHYSARTIIHVLRHHSMISEVPEGAWKINDHHSPWFARLFDLRYPEHKGLWEFRRTKQRIKVGNQSAS